MKFISWNVNGLRACTGKGFLDFFHAIDADIFCLQETKLQEGQISTGITPKRKAIPALPYLRKKNPCPSATA